MSFNPNPKLVMINQFGEESINAIVSTSTFGAPLVSSTVTLSAAQVIALNATPQVLVPAVAGKIIEVVAVILNYVYGSAAFTVGSSKVIKAQYHTGTILIGSVSDTGFIDQVVNKEATLYGAGVGGLGVRGQGVELTSDDTTIAVGTGGTLVCHVLYNLIG